VADVVIEQEYRPPAHRRAAPLPAIPRERYRLAVGTSRTGRRGGLLRVVATQAKGPSSDRQIGEIRFDGERMVLFAPDGREIPPPPLTPPPGAERLMPLGSDASSLHGGAGGGGGTPGLAYSRAQLTDMARGAGAVIHDDGTGVTLRRQHASPRGTIVETRQYATAAADAYRIRRITREWHAEGSEATMRTTTWFSLVADSLRPAKAADARLVSLAAPSVPPTVPARVPVRARTDAAMADLQSCPEGRRAGSTATGYELLLQHGINSTYDTWCRTRDSLHHSLRIAGTQAYSTGSLDRLPLQTERLESMRLAPSVLSKGTIVIGHSQGGLMGRYLASLPSSKGPISGVITVGTPHLGAPLVPAVVDVASFASEIGFFAGRIHCGQWRPDWWGGGGGPPGDPMQLTGAEWLSYVTCLWSSQVVSTSVFGFVPWLFPGDLVGWGGTLNGAFVDLHPSSTFLEYLNTTHEPFRRIGIYHKIPTSFAVCRLAAESVPLFDLESGADAALACEATFLTSLFRWGILQFFGDPFGDTEYYAALFIGLGAANVAWNLVTGAYQYGPGDGVVPAVSQYYPATPGAFTPVQYAEFPGPFPGNDSHVRQTRSGVTRGLIVRALREQFLVRREGEDP
jgi:hypothetical protein